MKNIGSLNSENWSPENDLEMVRSVIRNGASTNYVDETGMSALLRFTQCSCLDPINILLENGADVNFLDPQGRNCLMWVNDVNIARILIEKGADINAEDKAGNSRKIECFDSFFNNKT
jgi:ankyrin repeat protein